MSLEIAETDDLVACHALRRTVFMDEQGYSEAEEFDALDDGAVHLLATIDGRPVGTARLLIEGASGRIGRVCVLSELRGSGVGAALVQAGIDALGARPGIARLVLGAQCQAIGFYERLGFSVCGPVYDDGGVPHREMQRPV